jgi:glycosyltransferase involved in cell wall biosynthesis
LVKTSLIITVFNRSASLRKALLSLNNQSIKPDELILSDDGSEEDIVSAISGIVRKFNFPVKYVKQTNKGFRLAKARNNGVRNAEGNLIIFLDQDLIHTKGLIKTFITNWKEKRFITGMPVWLGEEQTLKITEQKIIDNDFLHLIDENLIDGIVKQFKKDRTYYYLHKLKFTNQPRLRGGICAINREDFEKINGYDEKFIGWGAEDDDLGKRLYKIGAEGFNPFLDEYAIHLFHPKAIILDKGVKEQANYQYYQKKKHEIQKGNYRAEFGLDNPYDEDKFTVVKLN